MVRYCGSSSLSKQVYVALQGIHNRNIIVIVYDFQYNEHDEGVYFVV